MVAADPTVLQYKRDVTLSLTRLATIHNTNGEYGLAEGLLAEAVTLRAEMVGASPDAIFALRDLSIAQNEHAASLLNLDFKVEALTVSQQSLETVDRLLQLAPDLPDHVHDRLVTLNRLGDAQVALGDHAAAVETFGQMVATGSQLLDYDAYYWPWASDLAVALGRLGDAQAATGDLKGALKSQQDSLALREWLVQQDPNDPQWYRNLATSYERVSLLFADLGDMQAALDHQDRSLSIMRDLSAAHPDDPWYRIDVVRALDLKAPLLKDPTATNQEALAILEEMYANGTLPPDYVEWITILRRSLGLPTEF
jgi:tetratricopeptide (TPR) repeat protein